MAPVAPSATLCSISKLKAMIAEAAQDAEIVDVGAAPLEMFPDLDEPRLVSCALLEDSVVTSHLVGEPRPAIRAFLDGKQRSEIVSFVKGVPLVAGTVGAAIRERAGTRSVTWGVRTERKLYAHATLLNGEIDLERLDGVELENTAPPPGTDAGSAERHPMHLIQRARHMVQNRREQLEQELAIEWALARTEPLLVDGGISRTAGIADSRCIIGLVKSHRTMYVRDGAVQGVLSLAQGSRSSAFELESRGFRTASWYLRLRRERGRDPLWGLVRVEVPMGWFSPATADEISRWILAESAPISLPDARWDRLLYGIRDCEMYLSAVM